MFPGGWCDKFCLPCLFGLGKLNKYEPPATDKIIDPISFGVLLLAKATPISEWTKASNWELAGMVIFPLAAVKVKSVSCNPSTDPPPPGTFSPDGVVVSPGREQSVREQPAVPLPPVEWLARLRQKHNFRIYRWQKPCNNKRFHLLILGCQQRAGLTQAT